MAFVLYDEEQAIWSRSGYVGWLRGVLLGGGTPETHDRDALQRYTTNNQL